MFRNRKVTYKRQYECCDPDCVLPDTEGFPDRFCHWAAGGFRQPFPGHNRDLHISIQPRRDGHYQKARVYSELHHDKENILRQRYGLIATAQSARSVGILMGSKPGQTRMNTAYYLRRILNEKQKTSVLMVVDYLTPDMVESFRGIDCIVSTLCPRLALDDAHCYKIPILTPLELEIVLGIKSWEDYTFDTFITE